MALNLANTSDTDLYSTINTGDHKPATLAPQVDSRMTIPRWNTQGDQAMGGVNPLTLRLNFVTREGNALNDATNPLPAPGTRTKRVRIRVVSIGTTAITATIGAATVGTIDALPAAATSVTFLATTDNTGRLDFPITAGSLGANRTFLITVETLEGNAWLDVMARKILNATA